MAKPPAKGKTSDKSEKTRKPASQAAAFQKDDRIQRMLQKAPVAAAITHAAVHLPKVEAPSLEGIRVSVPAAAAVSVEDLTARLHEALREAAPRRTRAPGEKVDGGDDVNLDIVGYSGGRIIPFSLRERVKMEVAPIPALPGFAEKLVGLEVGKSATFDITLPADYPVQHLRGQNASFLLDVNEAVEVRTPDPEDAATLKLLKRGNSLDAVMESLAAEIRAEREDAQILEAQDRVLDELCARVKIDLPDALIDEEIRRRWGEHEGKIAIRKDFSAEETNDALQGWLTDRATRIDAGRRLKISLGLRAIVEKEQLKVTADNISKILEPVAAMAGVGVDEVKAALKKQTTVAAHVIDTALHLLAVGFVVGKAEINFAD